MTIHMASYHAFLPFLVRPTCSGQPRSDEELVLQTLASTHRSRVQSEFFSGRDITTDTMPRINIMSTCAAWTIISNSDCSKPGVADNGGFCAGHKFLLSPDNYCRGQTKRLVQCYSPFIKADGFCRETHKFPQFVTPDTFRKPWSTAKRERLIYDVLRSNGFQDSYSEKPIESALATQLQVEHPLDLLAAAAGVNVAFIGRRDHGQAEDQLQDIAMIIRDALNVLKHMRVTTARINRAKATATERVVNDWLGDHGQHPSYTALLLDANNGLGRVETRNIRISSIAVARQLILRLQNEAEDTALTNAVVTSIQDVVCLINS